MIKIPFNKPALTGNELRYIKDAVDSGKISGDGGFTKKCQEFLEKKFNAGKVLLTTSGTGALEMSALLIDIQPGDEVIMPSYTFVSTANAFILRGAKPVFIDIREDTLNLDEKLIEEKITDRTRAIIPVHYAGVSCELDTIMDIARKRNFWIVEDAAQGITSRYKDKYLGTVGDLGAFSFHETKNVICGEGGALLVNNEDLRERAEIIWEKGTNRKKFFRGEVDKYTWIDIGSSYLMSDVLAAYLYAQLENLEKIQNKRKEIYNYYIQNLQELEREGKIRLPVVPEDCETNYHLFYILLPDREKRDSLLRRLRAAGIHAVFHYVPLHVSPMGERFGYRPGDLPLTESLSERLIRLPLFYDLSLDEAEFIIAMVKKHINRS
ncbi:MAG: dTDP-4-amino-4,6-dideoxygalactose transaminase [Candidatus Euphemobacter frigidus]|nr:dTDP-4-amino-4,6-dideoxygalactose transaminase [Candidatus Euphemobacter frigidus]